MRATSVRRPAFTTRRPGRGPQSVADSMDESVSIASRAGWVKRSRLSCYNAVAWMRAGGECMKQPVYRFSAGAAGSDGAPE